MEKLLVSVLGWTAGICAVCFALMSVALTYKFFIDFTV